MGTLSMRNQEGQTSLTGLLIGIILVMVRGNTSTGYNQVGLAQLGDTEEFILDDLLTHSTSPHIRSKPETPKYSFHQILTEQSDETELSQSGFEDRVRNGDGGDGGDCGDGGDGP